MEAAVMAEAGCGHGALVHYKESPPIIYGTRQGRELMRQQNFPRVPHGRRMR